MNEIQLSRLRVPAERKLETCLNRVLKLKYRFELVISQSQVVYFQWSQIQINADRHNFSFLEWFFKMTIILANYKRRSAFDVFEHFLKSFFCNISNGTTNFCLEVSYVLRKVEIFLAIYMDAEKEIARGQVSISGMPRKWISPLYPSVCKLVV